MKTVKVVHFFKTAVLFNLEQWKKTGIRFILLFYNRRNINKKIPAGNSGYIFITYKNYLLLFYNKLFFVVKIL